MADDEQRYSVLAKWGENVLKKGFTILPNHLMGINLFVSKEKKLSPAELLVLFHLVSVWWDVDRLPFPSKSTLSKRTGISVRQVQRVLNNLEKKGLIRRYERYSENRAKVSNIYDLAGTVELVKEMATLNPTAFKRGKQDNWSNEALDQVQELSGEIP